MDDVTTTALNLSEYEELARSVLPAMHYDYIAGGADDLVTIHGNRRAFERWVMVPRVLRGVKRVDLSISLLGREVSMPVLMCPVAFQRLAHPLGEAASATAAAKAGTIFTLSTLSTVTMEEVGEASSIWWFQLYCYKDLAVTKDLIERAEAAGAAAIVMTVDTPKIGRREGEGRYRFALPEGVELVNIKASAGRRLPTDVSGSGFAAYVSDLWEPAISWDHFEWVRAQTNLPLGVKGILSPEDALLACDHGASFIVVSNHGGRQLDHAIPTLQALPPVVEVVDGRCPVLLDGGVRRGTDVLKALALGASAAMIGRPYVWGLAHDGQRGVEHVLELMRAELEMDMLLCGCATVNDIGFNLLSPAL